MNKLLVVLFALGAILCLVDAMDKEEIFHEIHEIGHREWRKQAVLLENAAKDTATRMKNPEQKKCFQSRVAFARREMVDILSKMLNGLRSQYRTMVPDELERLEKETEVVSILKIVDESTRPLEETIAHIRQCV